MKVVIFCGGLGVRMGEETQRIPKPMIEIGGRPILWHIMRYYASWGHNEFILCLGYKGEVIKRVLPLVQRGAVQRLRARSRTATGTKLELLSRDLGRVADHVRRHRAQLDDRRAAQGGRAAHRRRRDVPRDLRRRPHRRAASRRHRRVPREREDRACSSRCDRSSTPISCRPTPTAPCSPSRT